MPVDGIVDNGCVVRTNNRDLEAVLQAADDNWRTYELTQQSALLSRYNPTSQAAAVLHQVAVNCGSCQQHSLHMPGAALGQTQDSG